MAHEALAASYLDRILDPLADCLNEVATERLLALEVDPEIQARIEVLAERANEGELTPEERSEYLSYVEAADLLAIFKLKARRQRRSDSIS